jgi:hypothetical protein
MIGNMRTACLFLLVTTVAAQQSPTKPLHGVSRNTFSAIQASGVGTIRGGGRTAMEASYGQLQLNFESNQGQLSRAFSSQTERRARTIRNRSQRPRRLMARP